MFVNFWYAAARSHELRDRPTRVRMLGQDFALFRDAQGVARCVSDVCIHRGASLSDGKVADGKLHCPYHGWAFDGEGRCRWIPSLGRNAQIPSRARIDGYEAQAQKFIAENASLSEAEKNKKLAEMRLNMLGKEEADAYERRMQYENYLKQNHLK